jgi:hypothetical protein
MLFIVFQHACEHGGFILLLCPISSTRVTVANHLTQILCSATSAAPTVWSVCSLQPIPWSVRLRPVKMKEMQVNPSPQANNSSLSAVKPIPTLVKQGNWMMPY